MLGGRWRPSPLIDHNLTSDADKPHTSKPAPSRASGFVHCPQSGGKGASTIIERHLLVRSMVRLVASMQTTAENHALNDDLEERERTTVLGHA